MRYRLSVLTLLLPIQLFAIEPAKVSFKCNIHTINKVEGQTECEPLDDEFGGYCIIEKSKHKNEQVGHMGLVLRPFMSNLFCKRSKTCHLHADKDCCKMWCL